MNRKIKSPVILILAFIFVLGSCSALFGQVEGVELYNKLRSGQSSLLKSEGERSVRWTPDGEAYFI